MNRYLAIVEWARKRYFVQLPNPKVWIVYGSRNGATVLDQQASPIDPAKFETARAAQSRFQSVETMAFERYVRKVA